MGYQSVFKPDLFKGQTIVVTGGGSGIGRATAHELASLGAFVVLVGRKQEKLGKVAAEIKEDGGQCSTMAFDIRDEDAVKAGIKQILADKQYDRELRSVSSLLKADGSVLCQAPPLSGICNPDHQLSTAGTRSNLIWLSSKPIVG